MIYRIGRGVDAAGSLEEEEEIRHLGIALRVVYVYVVGIAVAVC